LSASRQALCSIGFPFPHIVAPAAALLDKNTLLTVGSLTVLGLPLLLGSPRYLLWQLFPLLAAFYRKHALYPRKILRAPR